MNKQKEAVTYLAVGVGILALAMVIFYYVSDRMRTTENEVDLSQEVEARVEEKSEFIGVYSPSDGPLVSADKRISFFTVNQREEGGYLGSAKVTTLGSDEEFYFNCVDVRIRESEFFLNCLHETQGAISLNGQWEKSASGGIEVQGKVLWSLNSTPVLDVQRRFQHMDGE